MSNHQRIALVTGAAKGLGRAIAEHLGNAGCGVALHYRESFDEVDALKEQLLQAGVKAECFQADLSSATAVQNMAQEVIAQFGRIDFLINNVGAYSPKGLFETTPEEFNHILLTNISGTFFLSAEVLKSMRKHEFGRIINIGQASAERIRAYKNETPYQISKTAVLMLTKSIAQIEAKNGITCNMISPGIMVNSVVFPPDIEKSIPMGGPAEFSDIIGALDYLLSPAADYVTGTAIDVAGGYNL